MSVNTPDRYTWYFAILFPHHFSGKPIPSCFINTGNIEPPVPYTRLGFTGRSFIHSFIKSFIMTSTILFATGIVGFIVLLVFIISYISIRQMPPRGRTPGAVFLKPLPVTE